LLKTFIRLTLYNRECPNREGLQSGNRDEGVTSGREDKDKEPTRIETYVLDPSDIGILEGRPADGETGSTKAREKETKGKGEKYKGAAAVDLPSGPRQDVQVDEIQRSEVGINHDNEHEQNDFQDIDDPVSTPGK